MSFHLITQSSSRSTRPRSSDSTAFSPRSHRSSAISMMGVEISRRSTKLRAFERYSCWMSRALASRPLGSRTRRCPVTSWLISRMARIGFSIVRSRITTPSSIIRSTRSQEATLSSVVVSLMFESPTITCSRRYFSASACGSSRGLMIGRERVGALGTPPPMWSAPWEQENNAAGGLQHLAGAGDELTGHEERDEHVRQPPELTVPAHQVVLVAAVGVAGGVGVVLEQEDLAGDALFVQPALGVDHQALEDPLPRAVVDDELPHVVALGGRVLGVRTDVQVQARPVAEEDVARPPPRDDLAEQVAGHLVRRELALAFEGAGDPELGLDPEDSAVHGSHSRWRPRHRQRPGATERGDASWSSVLPSSALRALLVALPGQGVVQAGPRVISVWDVAGG